MFLLEEIYKELLLEAVKKKTIIDRINDKKVVLIVYKGDKNNLPGIRAIEIYALGTSKKTGRLMIRAFQKWGVSYTKTGNKNSINNIPSWRLFYIDKITSFKNTIQNHNGDRPLYKKNDKMMGNIIFQI